MWIFIDVKTTVECIMIAVILSSLLTAVWFRTLGILQSLGYKNIKFLVWAGRKSNLAQARYSVLALATVLSCAVISLCFSFIGHWGAVVGLAAYLIFFVLYVYSEARHTVKGSATLTPRFKRLLITVWLLTAILIYVVASALNFIEYIWQAPLFAVFKYCVLSAFPFASLLIMCLANLIAAIWEAPINASYVKKATKKLEESKLTVIGITGSYGKTSAKNILATLLAPKFKALATPSSYNTPLGIARTVNATDLTAYDIFIAEMGARREGDIAKLCAMCKPEYSIITGICSQHLESFKSVENIVKTKGEIITGSAKSTYVAADCYSLFDGIDGDKIICDCVKEVSADSTGTEFTLTLGEGSARVKTKLLGRHSAYNIGLCAQLAFALGVSFEEICGAVGNIGFTEHRLQLIENNGVHILDDGYNSNVVGARAAIEVLKSFGGRKIAVTPGLVELGVLEVKENQALGRELVGLDFVILVGETLVKEVLAGYTKAGGDENKITVVKSLVVAQGVLASIIEKGDCVLFLNDLPEQYL